MPIVYSMRSLPKVPSIYDVRRELATRDRVWFGKGNMYLYPSKRDFKGHRMRFRVNELFEKMEPKFIGVPENVYDFQIGRETNGAVFALSPEMTKVFCDTTLIDTIVYRMIGRTIVVVKKIIVSKRMYDGQVMRKFNVKGLKTVRGFASSRKYQRAILASIINSHCEDGNMMKFAEKISRMIPTPQSDGTVNNVIAAAFDPAMFRKIDAVTSSIPVLNRFVRTAQLSFMLVMTERLRSLPPPSRTLVIPLGDNARIEDRSLEEL